MHDSSYHDDGGHIIATGPLPKSGDLVSLDLERGIIPHFPIKRVYYIFDTAFGVVRGEHAHRKLWQLMHCPRGWCTITLDDGLGNRTEYVMRDRSQGLLVGPMTWRELKDFAPLTVVTVLASERYDAGDYISDYDEFTRLAGADPAG
jgi:hypothetical protein